MLTTCLRCHYPTTIGVTSNAIDPKSDSAWNRAYRGLTSLPPLLLCVCVSVKECMYIRMFLRKCMTVCVVSEHECACVCERVCKSVCMRESVYERVVCVAVCVIPWVSFLFLW